MRDEGLGVFAVGEGHDALTLALTLTIPAARLKGRGPQALEVEG